MQPRAGRGDKVDGVRSTRFLGLALAYYLGAQIGFAFQSPNTPQSVLWLPNSILLATLLLAPVSEWLPYLAAAFPAQMLVAWQAGAPVLPMALLFVTNCIDAALGAFLVRRFVRRPFRFYDLRSTAIFVMFGATLSPILLSFADAGLSVATGWAPSFWTAFSTRVHSNVLTHLIVVPALVTTLTVDLRQFARTRLIEIGIFSIALLAVCLVTFAEHSGSSALMALYLPLPLLLWAAVRFGPGGTGWSVLAVAFVASWNALHGRGPFTSSVPETDVRALQLFLLSISAPLLFLSATLKERDVTLVALRHNESSLRRSLTRVNDLTGKLIAAQELERMRIARDLHDDVSQRVAALSIGLSNLRSSHVPGDAGEVSAIRSLQEQATELVDGIRQLSHDLHVGTLDKAGLVATLREHCAEFGRQHHLDVTFAVHGRMDGIPHDVAITLYRIVQEALRNVSRHAATRHASVRLSRLPAAVRLRITDHGRGFDIEAARRTGGLGLLSIEERTKLIAGVMAVDTQPNHGTTIRIEVPLTPQASPEADVQAPRGAPPIAESGSPLPRVLLADDHQIVLEGLRHVLRDCCEIVAAVGDGPSLVSLATQLHPDIIVTDVSMPGFGAVEAMRRLKSSGIASKVIALTMHMDRDMISALLDAGAVGYVPKHVAGEQLVTAIRQVFDGFTYVSAVNDGPAPGASLTRTPS
jgi:signal transduction histidine kinase